MRFLHASIHRDELRALIAAAPVFGDIPPEPVMVDCPTCGDTFFADLAPYDEPLTQGASLVGSLDADCG
jgi:hypothetical protein